MTRLKYGEASGGTEVSGESGVREALGATNLESKRETAKDVSFLVVLRFLEQFGCDSVISIVMSIVPKFLFVLVFVFPNYKFLKIFNIRFRISIFKFKA